MPIENVGIPPRAVDELVEQVQGATSKLLAVGVHKASDNPSCDGNKIALGRAECGTCGVKQQQDEHELDCEAAFFLTREAAKMAVLLIGKAFPGGDLVDDKTGETVAHISTLMYQDCTWNLRGLDECRDKALKRLEEKQLAPGTHHIDTSGVGGDPEEERKKIREPLYKVVDRKNSDFSALR